VLFGFAQTVIYYCIWGLWSW